MNEKLFDYIKHSPTPFHAVAHTAEILKKAGYTYLSESRKWNIKAGKNYFTTRNSSSLIAFQMPKVSDFSGFMMSAAHCDSPCFKIKENAILSDEHYLRLSTEKYGGAIFSSWLDKPLSIAGRVVTKENNFIKTHLVDLAEPMAIIPNVAIHMNRTMNDGVSLDAAKDMLAVIASEQDVSLISIISEKINVAKECILSTDLFLYNPQAPCEFGGMITSPRLDDLQCAFASLEAFTQSKNEKAVNVYCLFDNEEVGSQTKQGAAGTFLSDTLVRICKNMNISDEEYRMKTANSFLVSCDNAHALHPNHPEYKDENHTVYLNKGIVIKYNANQNYTSDAVSSAIFKSFCDKAGVPYQMYANRANMPGGSTLGNIANTQVSLNTVDIGNAQLAMHSSYETAGSKDTSYMVSALKEFFTSSLVTADDKNIGLYN